MKTTWVVMEVVMGSEKVWAWGKASADGPGFDEIYYTERDGFTAAEVAGVPALGAHLFTVTVEKEEVAQSPGDKFREAAAEGRAALAAESPDGSGAVRHTPTNFVALEDVPLTRTIPEGTALEVEPGA